MMLDLFNLFIRMGLHGSSQFVVIHQAVHVCSAHLMLSDKDFNKKFILLKKKRYLAFLQRRSHRIIS